MEWSEIDIAWMAGLFEGEAYFGVNVRSKKRYKVSTTPPSPILRISMTDEDVISRVAKLLGQSYLSPSRKTTTGKTVYVVAVERRALLAVLYPRLFPYLGKRRQEVVQNSIDLLYDWELWFQKGGRNEMAKQGPLKKKLEKEKLMISKSNDMISPDV